MKFCNYFYYSLFGIHNHAVNFHLSSVTQKVFMGHIKCKRQIIRQQSTDRSMVQNFLKSIWISYWSLSLTEILFFSLVLTLLIAYKDWVGKNELSALILKSLLIVSICILSKFLGKNNVIPGDHVRITEKFKISYRGQCVCNNDLGRNWNSTKLCPFNFLTENQFFFKKHWLQHSR